MTDTTAAPGPAGLRRSAVPGPPGEVDLSARPTWRSSVARAVVGAEMVVWSDAGIHTLHPVARAVAEQLDGSASLASLAVDLAEVADLPAASAREVVALVVAELEGLDALGTGEERRSPVPSPPPVAATGRRSAAEVLPPDSCLGFKLRNGDAAPVLSFRAGDGAVRSVRCHDPASATLLRERGGEHLVVGEPGPIEAFVVAPFEGCGPVRVYDGEGVRRGRPRTPAQVVEVVDQVLGRRAALDAPAASTAAPSGLVALGRPDGSVVLTAPDALDGVGLAHRLQEAGVRVTWVPALIGRDGRVASPSAFGAPAVSGPVDEVLLPGAEALTAAQRLRALLGPAASTAAPGERADLLDRAAAVVRGASWTALVHPVDVHLGGDRLIGG